MSRSGCISRLCSGRIYNYKQNQKKGKVTWNTRTEFVLHFLSNFKGWETNLTSWEGTDEHLQPFSLMFCVQARGINLSCVRTCVVVAEERPRVALTQSFSKLFKDIGLSSRAVSTTFGSRVNVAICLQVRLPKGSFFVVVTDTRLQMPGSIVFLTPHLHTLLKPNICPVENSWHKI